MSPSEMSNFNLIPGKFLICALFFDAKKKNILGQTAFSLINSKENKEEYIKKLYINNDLIH